MRIFAGLFIVLSHVAGTSSAQDLTARSAQLAKSFEGTYLGFGLGTAAGSGVTDYPVLSGGTTYASYDPSNGKAFSGFVGYNFRRDNFVYGAELHLMNLANFSQYDPSESREVMDLADVRARAGRVFDNWMVYGALGWTWARFRVHPGTKFGDRPNETTLQGLNLGLGFEYNINERWFAGAEVTYRDLDGRFTEATRDTKMDLSNITLRLAYRF